MQDNNAQKGELIMLSLEAIDVAEGFNPRAEVRGESFDELVESVRRRGVLQPILVEPEGERYRLVAGNRRLEAARDAGLAEIPAYARELDGEAFEAAIVENLTRQDLAPVEEARALERALDGGKLKQRELAERLGRSPRWVSERLRLLRLPEGVQRAIDAGTIPAGLAPELERVAKVSTAVADGVARLFGEELVDAQDFASDPGRCLMLLDPEHYAGAGGKGREPLPFCRYVAGHVGVDLSGVELPEEHTGLRERYEALTESRQAYGVLGLRWQDSDTDAARSYGCLVEVGEGYRGRRFVCDLGFFCDRLEGIVARAEREEKRRRKEEEERVKAAAERAGVELDPDTDPEEQAKAARRAEREADREAQVAARGQNLDLGRRVTERLHRPKITKDVARLLALLVLERDGASIAARGLRYTEERLQEVSVRELKSGEKREKVTYADHGRAAELLYERLDRARSAEEIVGVVLQALVACHLADERCLPRSQRTHYALPGSYGSAAHTREIPALVERVAKGSVPPALRDELAERRAAREEGAQASAA